MCILHAGKKWCMWDGLLLELQKKKMNLRTKQHVCIEFCIWLEKTPKEKVVILKTAFGDKCRSNLNIKKWHKEFKDSRKSVHSVPGCGRPRTLVTKINTNTVASIIEDDRHFLSSWTCWKCQGIEYWWRNSKRNMFVLHEFLICSHKNKWDFISGWPRKTWRNFMIQITSIVKEWSLSTNCGFTATILN